MDLDQAQRILRAVPGSYRWPAIREAQLVVLAEVERLRAQRDAALDLCFHDLAKVTADQFAAMICLALGATDD